MRLGLAVALASLPLVANWLHAQSSPIVANSPAFEVASVKPAKSGGLPPFVRSPDRFTMRAPLRVHSECLSATSGRPVGRRAQLVDLRQI